MLWKFLNDSKDERIDVGHPDLKWIFSSLMERENTSAGTNFLKVNKVVLFKTPIIEKNC